MGWHKVEGAPVRHFRLECGILQLEFFLVWHRAQLGSHPRVVGRILAALARGSLDLLGKGGYHLSVSLVGPYILCAQQRDMHSSDLFPSVLGIDTVGYWGYMFYHLEGAFPSLLEF